MKFSVVIPALNEEKVISNAIRGLQNQRYPRKNFEIIVVDNNSSDRTSKEARKAGADKVVLEKRRGTNLARQKGFSVSKGDVVAFMDADCTPPPHWLSSIEKAISKKGVVAVSGPYRYGKFLPDFLVWRVYPLVPKIMSFLTRKKGGLILGGNFAVRRGALDKIGGLPPLRFFGDDTAIAILLARRVGRILYTRSVWVESSPRRLEERGMIRTGLKYFKHYFQVYFDEQYK